MLLLRDNLSSVLPLFASEHLQLVASAVSAGNSPGAFWVDEADQPRSAALWDKTHALYLAWAADHAAFNDALSQFVRDTVAQAVDVLKIYPASADWNAVIEALYPYEALYQPQRVFYRLVSLKIPDWRDRLPEGYRVSSINDNFTALTTLQNFERLREEIESCWNALADFQQQGFGFCAHDGETIVGWCTAEYVSGRQCGIGIETVETHQRQGFATLVASAFAEHCLEHGITAHWDAWQRNMPSVATAEKVGFVKVEDYTIYFAELKLAHKA
jgi:RimJ/RimL family protein N-acetyltransferase